MRFSVDRTDRFFLEIWKCTLFFVVVKLYSFYFTLSIRSVDLATLGAVLEEFLQKVDLLPHTRTISRFSRGCCAYERERSERVWPSETNATGASCPQVHYSLRHWANWLMWPCNNEYMKQKNPTRCHQEWQKLFTAVVRRRNALQTLTHFWCYLCGWLIY